MSTFYIVDHVATTTDYFNITDLHVMMVDGQAYLFASTQYDGTLTNWAISQSGLTLVGTTVYRGGLQAGDTNSSMQVNVGGMASVLTGGATESGALQTHEITASGAFTGRNVLGTAASPLANLIHGETVTLSNGTQVVYGGIAGADGIGRLNFDAQDNVQSAATTLDTANVFAASVFAACRRDIVAPWTFGRHHTDEP